ncbi:MAG: phosphodiesterase [Oscillospiraceae bacterium]|nr:phosphodiesterase [Clostridia bacterium]MBP0989964.1 phosphodiesterase [Oscillospiraceae bacterium]
MRLLIASDIHGSNAAVKVLQQKLVDEGAEELILLGDIYNHGPRNPFPEEYAPMKVAEALNKMNNLTVIKGNCDSEVDEMISSFVFSESAYVFSDGKKIFLTHGHKYNENTLPAGCKVIIYGHFHVGFIKEKDGVIIANPGSVSLPKNNSEPSYLLLADGKLQLKSISSGKVLAEKDL